MTWLLAGDYEHGWPEYEWRWRCREFAKHKRTFLQPLWDGSSLTGRTILLYGEQGLGDTIQFIRYAPLVKERGGRVIVECQPLLVPLLKGVAGVDEIIPEGSPLPAVDVQAPLLQLPAILSIPIPAKVPYLAADPELVRWWGATLDKETGRQGDKEISRQRVMGKEQVSLSPCLPVSLSGFRIGIAWQGNPTHKKDKQRSIPLPYFEPLARLEGVRLFSLQKGTGSEQLAQLSGRFPITDLGSRLETFLDTAAVLKNLDLVVACDTGAVHLAAPWVFPSGSSWHSCRTGAWLLQREDSPWYPTMRLFRQKRWGDWDEVFQRIVQALRKLRKDEG